ncbi:Hypothetical protein conserved in the Yarrowia clade [Yarrowia lipolytica]|nr:Hypothetical protein conserved in the Yarrowia clade [Yarrowia lipolytica]
MAEVTVKDPAYGGQELTISSLLFSPYSFFVTIDVPKRKAVMALISKGGGTIVSRPSNTTPIDYWLVPDYFEGNTRLGAKRVSIVLDSARQGQFPPLRDSGGEDYYSPFAKTKKARTEYTDGEVRFLTAYIDMHVGKPPLGKSDLRYLFELMNHKHTEESIRSKLKQLEKFPVNLERTKPVSYQAPVVENDLVAKKTTETPIPGTRFPDVLLNSIPAAKRTSADTVLATPVPVKPLAMSTQLPDTTMEVPDTPIPSKNTHGKTKQGNTQVPGTPETKKGTFISPQKLSPKSAQSSQSSNQVPDTPAKSEQPAPATEAAQNATTVGLHKNPAITEVPATPAGPDIQVEDSTTATQSSKRSKSPSKSPSRASESPSASSKQLTLPFQSISGPISSTASSSDSEPLVMRFSPKKNRKKTKEPLYAQAQSVDNSSTPSSTRFTSSQMVPDSQQSMSSTPLKFDTTARDSSGITESQIYSAALTVPPGSSELTVDESSGSLEHIATVRLSSVSRESKWSRDSSMSVDSNGLDIYSQGSQVSQAGRRTRASRSLAASDLPPPAVQTGSCVLFPRKFITKYSHHPIRGVFYGIEKVSSQQTDTSQGATRQIEMTQVEARQMVRVEDEGVVAKAISSQSSSSFAEDSHLFVQEDSDGAEKEEKEKEKEGDSDEEEGEAKEMEEGDGQKGDDEEEEEIVQVLDTQENHILRDAQLTADSYDDVSSVPDSQASVIKRPSAFRESPVPAKRRYLDSSLDLDVSVPSLPSINNIRARLKELSDRVSSEGHREDVIGSQAKKRVSWSSLGRQVAVLELDSDGDVVEESFIEGQVEGIKEVEEVEAEEVEDESPKDDDVDEAAAEEHVDMPKEHASIIYEDAQRRPSSSQLDESLGLVSQRDVVVVEELEVEAEEEQEIASDGSKKESEDPMQPAELPRSDSAPQISEIHFDAVDRFQSLLPNDVIDELLESYEPEEEYPSEKFQVLAVPIRKDLTSVDLDPSFSVLDFPFEEISFDDIRDDLDYGEEEGLSQKEPMIDSSGIRPAVECVGLFLQSGVEEYLCSIQGHNPSVSAVFVIALCMSRQVTEHTTLEEVEKMDFRFPRHVKFFSPKDDQVIANYTSKGPSDEGKFSTLKRRHFIDDILRRSEYLKAVSLALETEETGAEGENEGEVLAGSSADRSDRIPQDVKMELFDVFEVPRDYNPPAHRSPEPSSQAYKIDSSTTEPSLEERRLAMEEKIRQLRAKKKAKKARREKRESLRFEKESPEVKEDGQPKKKRRRKDDKEDKEDDKEKKKRRKSKKSEKAVATVESEVVGLVAESPDLVEKGFSQPLVTETPKRKSGRPKDESVPSQRALERHTKPRTRATTDTETVIPEAPQTAPTPKRRGRPSHPAAGRAISQSPVSEATTLTRRRSGRPKKTANKEGHAGLLQ